MLSLVENSFKKNPLQDLLSSLKAVISTNESTRTITGHVIYNPAYIYKSQLKIAYVSSLIVAGSKEQYIFKLDSNLKTKILFDIPCNSHQSLNILLHVQEMI